LEFHEIIKDPMATMSAADNREENRKKRANSNPNNVDLRNTKIEIDTKTHIC